MVWDTSPLVKGVCGQKKHHHGHHHHNTRYAHKAVLVFSVLQLIGAMTLMHLGGFAKGTYGMSRHCEYGLGAMIFFITGLLGAIASQRRSHRIIVATLVFSIISVVAAMGCVGLGGFKVYQKIQWKRGMQEYQQGDEMYDYQRPSPSPPITPDQLPESIDIAGEIVKVDDLVKYMVEERNTSNKLLDYIEQELFESTKADMVAKLQKLLEDNAWIPKEVSDIIISTVNNSRCPFFMDKAVRNVEKLLAKGEVSKDDMDRIMDEWGADKIAMKIIWKGCLGRLLRAERQEDEEDEDTSEADSGEDKNDNDDDDVKRWWKKMIMRKKFKEGGSSEGKPWWKKHHGKRGGDKKNKCMKLFVYAVGLGLGFLHLVVNVVLTILGARGVCGNKGAETSSVSTTDGSGLYTSIQTAQGQGDYPEKQPVIS